VAPITGENLVFRSESTDFLHGAHARRRKRTAFVFEMMDHVIDHPPELPVELDRVVAMDASDQVGA
jgi:hypothetical protein